MTLEQELTEKFAKMDILELEDIVRNRKNEYTTEAYSIACGQFTLRYSDNPDIIIQAGKEKNAQEVLDEIDKRVNPPMNWYYWIIYFWLPVSILRTLASFTSVSEYSAELPDFAALVCLLIMVELSLAILSEIFIVKKMKIGLWLFLAFFIFEMICILISSKYVELLSFFIFSILNGIYFYKRWHLFK